MHKYLTRMRILQKPHGKTQMTVFNRWKEFVGLRKLLKYQFSTCHNQTRDEKADI